MRLCTTDHTGANETLKHRNCFGRQTVEAAVSDLTSAEAVAWYKLLAFEGLSVWKFYLAKSTSPIFVKVAKESHLLETSNWNKTQGIHQTTSTSNWFDWCRSEADHEETALNKHVLDRGTSGQSESFAWKRHLLRSDTDWIWHQLTRNCHGETYNKFTHPFTLDRFMSRLQKHIQG